MLQSLLVGNFSSDAAQTFSLKPQIGSNVVEGNAVKNGRLGSHQIKVPLFTIAKQKALDPLGGELVGILGHDPAEPLPVVG